MGITIKLKRGTSASCNSYTGSAGELVYDTTNNILRLHNGTKAGGYQLWNSDTIDGRYLKLTGGTLNGGLLVGPNGSDSEGGQIGLKPGTDSDYGVWIDTTAGNFRVFGMTNPGSVFAINPQTDVISYNGKHLIRSINNTTADSTGNVSLSLNYLPLTGGELSGPLKFTKTGETTTIIRGSSDDSEFDMYGGASGGARIALNGINRTNYAGQFIISANTSDQTSTLHGYPNGTLNWNGRNIALKDECLQLSGGRMTGALNYANSTWNYLGDDVYFGDHDIAGAFCLKGANGTTKIVFYKQDESA